MRYASDSADCAAHSPEFLSRSLTHSLSSLTRAHHGPAILDLSTVTCSWFHMLHDGHAVVALSARGRGGATAAAASRREPPSTFTLARGADRQDAQPLARR